MNLLDLMLVNQTVLTHCGYRGSVDTPQRALVCQVGCRSAAIWPSSSLMALNLKEWTSKTNSLRFSRRDEICTYAFWCRIKCSSPNRSGKVFWNDGAENALRDRGCFAIEGEWFFAQHAVSKHWVQFRELPLARIYTLCICPDCVFDIAPLWWSCGRFSSSSQFSFLHLCW